MGVRVDPHRYPRQSSGGPVGGSRETIERAGSGFAGTLFDISSKVSDVPLVGPALRAPLPAAGEAGRVLEQAGASRQEVVHTLAVWLGVLLAVIPLYELRRVGDDPSAALQNGDYEPLATLELASLGLEVPADALRTG